MEERDEVTTVEEPNTEELTDEKAQITALTEMLAELTKSNEALMKSVNELKVANQKMALKIGVNQQTDLDLFASFDRRGGNYYGNSK